MLENFSYEKSFWKVLTYLDNLEEEITVEDLAILLGIEKDLVFRGIQFFERFNIEYKCVRRGSKTTIYPFPSQINMSISLSLTEWLSLENYLPKNGSESSNFTVNKSNGSHKNIQKNFFEILNFEKKKEKLISKIRSDCKQHYEVVSSIEKALRDGSLVNVELLNSKKEEIFPRSLSYVDGNLYFIGEEKKDRCLVYVNTKEIQSINLICGEDYKKNFSLKEVNDFINSLRHMGGKELRVVLKFHTNDVNLTPPINFYDQPYVTYSSDGSLIWSASLELGNDLFEWLLKNDNQVEIIDPFFLRKELDDYKSHKLKDSKKAS